MTDADKILNVSQAMKCEACGAYIVTEKQLFSKKYCSQRCQQIGYKGRKRRKPRGVMQWT